MVHRTDVAEGPAAHGGLDEVRHERVAGRAADALAKPVGHPHEDHADGRRDQAHERPDDRREPVAEEHQRPAAD